MKIIVSYLGGPFDGYEEERQPLPDGYDCPALRMTSKTNSSEKYHVWVLHKTQYRPCGDSLFRVFEYAYSGVFDADKVETAV